MVVADGETVMLPEVGCVPIPLSIDTDVAFVVDHVSVDAWPAEIAPGFAENEIVGGGCVPLDTVTVVVEDEVPPGPEAVNVYVVVEVGETEMFPFTG